MSEHPADSLSRRYRSALTLVASLLLLNQLLVQPSLLRLTTDAPVINIAGRQRMLSQRLAKAALALERADGATRPSHLAELEQALALWTASHNGLRSGNRAMSLPGGNSPVVAAAFDDLEPSYLLMRDAAARLISTAAGPQAGNPSASDDVDVILKAEPEYLGRMDAVVGLFEREARHRVAKMFWTGWVVTGLILLALAAIGRSVLRPALTLVRRQFDELGRAKVELEYRVRQRTRELELATERHQTLVEEFSHVARTTTIGEMASGLAHELNQPLGAIANYAGGCLVELASPRPAMAEVQSALEKVVAASLRAGQVIERIRKFVTRQELRREPFDSNRVVVDVEEILRDEARQRGIGMVLDLAPDLPRVCGDAVQVQQVLVNLVRNAFDAIAAAKPHAPELVILTRRATAGGVVFSVTDNGEGIEPERIGKVFDAYFSTRAGGMGMGLAISRTIIESHQGRITVTSIPGVTTTFRFTLPDGTSDDERSQGLHR
jgi:signal transduction histidine kinase